MEATFLEITLSKGLFVKTNGINVIKLKKKYVNANGWECFIEKSGRIRCRVIEGDKELNYCISKSGYARMTYKEKDGTTRILKEGYVIGKTESIKNGTIFLSDGPILKRHTFFRSAGLQKFYTKYGINRIKRENPNTVYSVRNGHCNNLDASEEVAPIVGTYCEIITDGDKEIIAEVQGSTEKLKEKFPNCNAFELEEMVEVKNATWVIKHIKTWNENEVREYRVLYSLKDYKDLNIPDEYKVN